MSSSKRMTSTLQKCNPPVELIDDARPIGMAAIEKMVE
jgi:hypothetical protein